MFHVFALAYHSTSFLWPTLLLFYRFASYERIPSRERVQCACAAQVRSHLNFFKLTDMWSEAVHKICSSSWSGDRNFFYKLIFYKKCLMGKWSSSNIEEVRFFESNSKFCSSFNNGDRKNFHRDVFVPYK